MNQRAALISIVTYAIAGKIHKAADGASDFFERWEHYHRPDDTAEKLNFNKMALICEYLVRLSSELAAMEVTRSGIDCDTLEFEIASVETPLGKYCNTLLYAIGVGILKNRKDMDRFADTLKSFGL